MQTVALNLVTAAIILFNCLYLDRAMAELRKRGTTLDPALLSQLFPLGWDRVNLTGDYIWSDGVELDADGLMPLQPTARPDRCTRTVKRTFCL
jgi:hypothetical protein